MCARSVQVLLNNDVEAVCPDTYFVKETLFFGRADLVELKPGGSSMLLTNANKGEYAQLAARHAMTTAIKEPVLAFQQGLWEVRTSLGLFAENAPLGRRGGMLPGLLFVRHDGV
jgi:HECT-domain (ubiquitin-transferase)